MNKPNNYETTKAAGDFQPIELGGHVMRIVSVEETKSRTNKDMLKIFLDTDRTDKQPGYFKKNFDDDIRPNKKWGCIIYQLTEDKDGNCSRGLKTFITSVEKSNPGFKVVWGDGFAECFKNKLVGGVFGREEYLNDHQEKKMATKMLYFRSVEKALKADIPDDKMLPVTPNPANANNGFMNIPDGIDEELPFN